MVWQLAGVHFDWDSLNDLEEDSDSESEFNEDEWDIEKVYDMEFAQLLGS